MATARATLVVIILVAMAAGQASSAAPDMPAVESAAVADPSTAPEPRVAPKPFDWHELRSAVQPLVDSLTATPWSTCLGHVSAHLGLDPGPIESPRCTDRIDTPSANGKTHEDERDMRQGEIPARWRDTDGNLHDEPPWEADPPYEPYRNPNEPEEKRREREERQNAGAAQRDSLQFEPTAIMAR